MITTRPLRRITSYEIVNHGQEITRHLYQGRRAITGIGNSPAEAFRNAIRTIAHLGYATGCLWSAGRVLCNDDTYSTDPSFVTIAWS